MIIKKLKIREIDNGSIKISKEQMGKIFEQPVTYIFGKNGSGKTSISHNLQEYKNNEVISFVFNKTYVNLNIYEEKFADGEAL